jgi:hypothetical protein
MAFDCDPQTFDPKVYPYTPHSFPRHQWQMDIPFILNTGDSFYEHGIKSASDSLVSSSYTSVFVDPYPALQKPWLSVLGNHDYYGSVLAQLEMHQSNATPHWYMPDRNYTYTFA